MENNLKDISILTNQVLKHIEHPTKPNPQKENEFNKNNLYDFIRKFHLNEFIARNWYEWKKEKGLIDSKGNPIKNWKGALLNLCRSKKDGIIKKESKENGQHKKPIDLWR